MLLVQLMNDLKPIPTLCLEEQPEVRELGKDRAGRGDQVPIGEKGDEVGEDDEPCKREEEGGGGGGGPGVEPLEVLD